MDLTRRQREILSFIEKEIATKGYPPTIREIAKRFSFSSTATVRDHLRALMEKGYIKREHGLSRGIRIVKKSPFSSESTVPIAGRIVAGYPELAIEEIEGELKVDERMIRGQKSFALRVKGDSMLYAGILDGDYVIIRVQPVCTPGDIVVALVGDEATVKRLTKKAKTLRLSPENPSYEPIEIDDRVRIIGKVIGLIRYYR